MKNLPHQITILSLLIFVLFSSTMLGQRTLKYIPYRIDNQWGMADVSGNLLFKPRYQETFPAGNEVIRFREDSLYGFINTEGEVIIPAIYEKASDFSYTGINAKARVTLNGSRFGIDINGNKTKLRGVCGGSFMYFIDSSVKIIQENGMYGLIVRGDTTINPTFKHIKNYEDKILEPFRKDKLVVVQNFDDHYGLISYKGDTIHDITLDSVVICI